MVAYKAYVKILRKFQTSIKLTIYIMNYDGSYINECGDPKLNRSECAHDLSKVIHVVICASRQRCASLRIRENDEQFIKRFPEAPLHPLHDVVLHEIYKLSKSRVGNFNL